MNIKKIIKIEEKNPNRIRTALRPTSKQVMRFRIVMAATILAVAVFTVAYIFFNLGTPKHAFAMTAGPNKGSTFANVPISGSISTWTNPDNVAISDDVYTTNTTNIASATSYSDYLQVTNFGFAIPTSSIIVGIL